MSSATGETMSPLCFDPHSGTNAPLDCDDCDDWPRVSKPGAEYPQSGSSPVLGI
ncbi:hypothetical protein Vi05172_g5423 [Venturia inaequalis]|nr:hypothetical protein Vi05172_g5423 [Venturia inaequalis]